MVKSCRDCANFEDRRDIDDIALCAENIGPRVCCEEFELRDEAVNEDRLYNRFCLECANFEEIDNVPTCAMNHTPGVACEAFVDRFEVLKATRQSNHIKTAVVVHVLNGHPNPEPIPEYLVKIGTKIKW